MAFQTGGTGIVSRKRHLQRRRQLQRKHPRVDLHRSGVTVTGECLDNLRRLPVIQHVHDVRVPESVRCHRHREYNPVICRPLHRRLQPVTHCFIGCRPQGAASGPIGVFGLIGIMLAHQALPQMYPARAVISSADRNPYSLTHPWRTFPLIDFSGLVYSGMPFYPGRCRLSGMIKWRSGKNRHQ